MIVFGIFESINSPCCKLILFVINWVVSIVWSISWLFNWILRTEFKVFICNNPISWEIFWVLFNVDWIIDMNLCWFSIFEFSVNEDEFVEFREV
jgi:hypothetical protein